MHGTLYVDFLDLHRRLNRLQESTDREFVEIEDSMLELEKDEPSVYRAVIRMAHSEIARKCRA